MKVLYIDPNATTSQYSYPLVDALLNAGIDISYYSTVNRHISQYYIENYDIPAEYFYFKTANKINNQRLRRIVKVISYPLNCMTLLIKVLRLKPDIVHFNWLTIPLLDFITIKLLKGMGIKVIITKHNYLAHEKNNLESGALQCLESADQIVCLSNTVKNRFPQYLKSKISIINHGNTYLNELSRYKSKPIASDDTTLLFIGSIKPYKGVLLLLKAYSELVKAQKVTGLRLKIIGNCDKNLAKEINTYIEINNLEQLVESHFEFISYDQMFSYIENCDAGILPYQWGSQSGLPYLFYSFNKPLILSDSCGISEQGNPQISIITKPEIESIKKAIITFMINKDKFHPSDFVKFLSENDMKLIAQKMIKLYNKLLD